MKPLLIFVAGLSLAIAQQRQPQAELGSRETTELLLSLGHAEPISSLASSPNGEFLLSLSSSSLVVWSIKTGLQVASIPFPSGSSLRNGKFVSATEVSVVWDSKRLLLWDFASPASRVNSLEIENIIDYCPLPGPRVVALDRQGRVYLWSPQRESNPSPVLDVSPYGKALAIAASTDGLEFATAHESGDQYRVVIWKSNSSQPVTIEEISLPSDVAKIAYLENSKSIAFGTDMLSVVSMVNESKEVSVPADAGIGRPDIAKVLMPDGQAYYGAGLRAIWTQSAIPILSQPRTSPFDEFRPTTAAPKGSGGRPRFYYADALKTIKEVDPIDGNVSPTIRPVVLRVDGLSVSSNGLLVVQSGGSLRLWDLYGTGNRKGRLISGFRGNARISEDGSQITTRADHEWQGWSTKDESPIGLAKQLPKSSSNLVGISQNGNWIVTIASGAQVAVERADGSMPIAPIRIAETLRDRPIDYITVSNDGSTVLVMYNSVEQGPDRIWTGTVLSTKSERIFRITSRYPIQNALFSKDGSRLLTSGAPFFGGPEVPQSVQLWNVHLGQAAMPPITFMSGILAPPLALRQSKDRIDFLYADGNQAHLVSAIDNRGVVQFVGHSGAITALAFLGEGERIITGGLDGTVRVWTRDGRELVQLVSREVVDGSSRKKSSRAVLREYFGIGGIAIEAGLRPKFDTDELEDLEGIGWTVGGDVLSPLSGEIFMRDYYEPRLLPRLLAGEQLPEVRPLGDLNRVQPKVVLVSVKPGRQPDLAEVTVEFSGNVGQFHRKGKPFTMSTDVYDLRLFREGQLVGQEPELNSKAEVRLKNGVALTPQELREWQAARRVKPGKDRVTLDPKTGKMQRTFTVRLPHGRAGKKIEFAAYAFNLDRVKSATATLEYDVPKDLLPVRPRAYLLSMGVNAYQNPDWNLHFAASDARIMQAELKKRLESQYDVVPVELISDCKQEGCPANGTRTTGENHATKAALRAVLARLAGQALAPELQKSMPPSAEKLQKATPDDLVLLTVSSHGYTGSDGMFYMIPSDSGKTDGSGINKGLFAGWISSDELAAWLRDVDTGELALIVDTCHSAATVESPGFKPGPMGSRGLGQLAYDKGMRILAASQANDVAMESDKIKQGLLTYALVQEGLKEGKAAPAGSDGTISLQAWLQYGVDRVPTLFEDIRAGRIVRRNVAAGEERREDATLSRNTGVAVQLSPTGTSSLDKPRAFQQPTLFDFRRSPSAIQIRLLP
jgi:WD40 repeat protein